MVRQPRAEGRIAEQARELPRHLGAISGEQEILPRREQAGRRAPQRRDERDAARERLERADGRNAGQGRDVGPTRHVDGDVEAREHVGHLVIRQPAAVLDARAPERTARLLRIAHAVEPGLETQLSYGLDQELVQLRRTLLVAPVADPDEIAIAPRGRHRVKASHVGRLVPCPCPRRPSVLEVRVADHIAEREHPIVVGQVVVADPRSIGHGAVVRIVEEQHVRTLRAPVRTNRRDERMIVPLVHEHEVSVFQHRIQVEVVTVIAGADPGELRVRPLERRYRPVSLLRR